MKAIAAAGLTVGLLLSGCVADTAPESAPTSSVSPGTGGTGVPASPAASTSPVATREAVPVPAPPRPTDDRAGRVAFARYVLQGWVYALNTNEPQPLLDVSGGEPCDGCAELADELAERAEEGWYVALADVRVSGAEVTSEDGLTRVVLSVAIPESDTFHRDGTFRSTNPAHPRSSFEVAMTHDGQRFRLLSFSLY
jgi:hypothetical protein